MSDGTSSCLKGPDNQRASLYRILGSRSVPHAFRTITINDNEARLEFHQIRDQRIIELGKQNLLTSKNAEEYAGGKADDILAYCHGGEGDNDVVLKLR